MSTPSPLLLALIFLAGYEVKGGYEDSLPNTLHTIQSEKERRRIGVVRIAGLMLFQPFQEEGDAMLRFVVEYFLHCLFFSLSRNVSIN